MKFKHTLLLFPVFALCACGAKDLSQVEAVKRANDILAAQEGITELPAKLTAVQEIKTHAETSEGTTDAYVKSTYVIADLFASTSTYYEGTDVTPYTLAEYVYIQDGYLVALISMTSDGETNGSYIKIQVGNETYTKIQEVVDFADDQLASLSLKLPDVDDILYSEVLQNLESKYLTEEQIALLGYSDYSFTAKSSGEGHLRIEASATLTTLSRTNTAKTVAEWTNNFVTLISISNKNVSEEEKSDVGVKLTFNYSAKVAYPDLTNFEDITPKMS